MQPGRKWLVSCVGGERDSGKERDGVGSQANVLVFYLYITGLDPKYIGAGNLRCTSNWKIK